MADIRKYETDIAIIGSGGAGMAAGIETRDAGGKAIAFEKAEDLGGAAIISGGGCCIVGSPHHRWPHAWWQDFSSWCA